MKFLTSLFFIGLWKLKESSNNFIVNLSNNGIFSGFHENNNKKIKGYWEQKNFELVISTNESKIYQGQFKNNNLTKINGCVTYGFDSPDYLHNFELIPIYRNEYIKQAPVARALKHSSSFLGHWLFERKILTSFISIKKLKVNKQRQFIKIYNNEITECSIINVIKLNNNGTWSYGTMQGHLHLAGKWNLYNDTNDNINFNLAYNENKTGEHIWLKSDKDDSYFLGINITSNNISTYKITGHTLFGSIDSYHDNTFNISRWYNF